MLYKYTCKWWTKGCCVIHLKKTRYVICSSVNKDSYCWETHAVGFKIRISWILICYHSLLWVSHVVFLTFPFKFVYYVNGFIVFLNILKNLHYVVIHKTFKMLFLSEVIHVRCSQQFTVFHLIIMRFTFWLVPHWWLILFSFPYHFILQLTKLLDKS